MPSSTSSTGPAPAAVTVRSEHHDAVVFDLDGVITDTASLHAQAWKETFDEVLARHRDDPGVDARPFAMEADYVRHVDGKPRLDGVRDFLSSRGIHLQDGRADGSHGETIQAVGQTKNDRYLERLRRHGPAVYAGTLAFIDDLHAHGIRTGVISASRNAQEVLERGHVADLFEVCIDGEVARRDGLAGKPAPDVFLEASRRMGVEPQRTVVIEDAVAGVQAGRSGGFALVVGVDRGHVAEQLLDAGADVVVDDLDAVEVADAAEPTAGKDPVVAAAATTVHRGVPAPAGTGPAARGRAVADRSSAASTPRPVAGLPSALAHLDEVLGPASASRTLVSFDYDGTLTAIVRHPDLAVLSPEMRLALRSLATACPVALLSGRDLDDLHAKVDLDGLWYAGSHGFDLLGAEGERTTAAQAEAFVPLLEKAADRLAEVIDDVPGAWVERKRFAVAVHFREADPAAEPQIERAVDKEVSRSADLRSKVGKRIMELQPDIDWDKGKALQQTVDALGLRLDRDHVIYLGDDTTDEDAFRTLDGTGVGILVTDAAEPRETTWARFVLNGVEDVQRFMAEAAQRLGQPSRQGTGERAGGRPA